jgi:ComF family protein
MFLRELLRGLSDVIFPPVCVHCRGLVEDSPFRHLCRHCGDEVEPAPAFEEGCAAVRFRGPVRALVVELKYHRGLYVLADVEAIFRRAPALLDKARGATLVPVPLHPRKRRERGFNQSELIARALVRATGEGARIAPFLRRVVDTPSQTSLDRQARRANLKNAFALKRGAGLNPGHRYLLVDDVFTTGSTLSGCARVLRRAGCLNLDCVTLAHG